MLKKLAILVHRGISKICKCFRAMVPPLQFGPTILPYPASLEKFIWVKVEILLALVAFIQGHIMGHNGWSNICSPCSECPNVQMSTACVCRPDLMKHASLTLAVVLCPVPGGSYTNSKTKIYTHKYKHTNTSTNSQMQRQTQKCNFLTLYCPLGTCWKAIFKGRTSQTLQQYCSAVCTLNCCRFALVLVG